MDHLGPLPRIVLAACASPTTSSIELLLLAARSLGVRHLTLVAPYLAYMRQDIAFTPARQWAVHRGPLFGRFV